MDKFVLLPEEQGIQVEDNGYTQRCSVSMWVCIRSSGYYGPVNNGAIVICIHYTGKAHKIKGWV
jgi:hypothetical protein